MPGELYLTASPVLLSALVLLLACSSESDPKDEETAPIPESFVEDEAASYVDLSVGTGLTCTVDVGGTVYCWGRGIGACHSPPASLTVVDVDAGLTGGAPCAIDASSRDVVCWSPSTGEVERTVPGPFVQLSDGCGLREDLTISCWRDFQECVADPPAGTYTYVNSGDAGAAVSTEGDMALWGPYTCDVPDMDGGCSACPAGAVVGEGPFLVAHSAPAYLGACGALESGGISCFQGSGSGGVLGEGAPSTGQWVDLAMEYWQSGCGLSADGQVACWGFGLAVPDEAFVKIENDHRSAFCGLRVDGVVDCWGETKSLPWEPCDR